MDIANDVGGDVQKFIQDILDTRLDEESCKALQVDWAEGTIELLHYNDVTAYLAPDGGAPDLNLLFKKKTAFPFKRVLGEVGTISVVLTDLDIEVREDRARFHDLVSSQPLTWLWIPQFCSFKTAPALFMMSIVLLNRIPAQFLVYAKNPKFATSLTANLIRKSTNPSEQIAPIKELGMDKDATDDMLYACVMSIASGTGWIFAERRDLLKDLRAVLTSWDSNAYPKTLKHIDLCLDKFLHPIQERVSINWRSVPIHLVEVEKLKAAMKGLSHEECQMMNFDFAQKHELLVNCTFEELAPLQGMVKFVSHRWRSVKLENGATTSVPNPDNFLKDVITGASYPKYIWVDFLCIAPAELHSDYIASVLIQFNRLHFDMIPVVNYKERREESFWCMAETMMLRDRQGVSTVDTSKLKHLLHPSDAVVFVILMCNTAIHISYRRKFVQHLLKFLRARF